MFKLNWMLAWGGKKVFWRVCCNGFAVKKCFKLCWNVAEKHGAGNSSTIRGCSFLPTFTLPLKQVSVEGGMEKPACVFNSLFLLLPSPPGPRPSPPSLAQPLLFSMCNLKLICTTGYLTGATDTESVLFLLKHSPCLKACRILVSHQGLNYHPWQWKFRVLITGLRGNSLFVFKTDFLETDFLR